MLYLTINQSKSVYVKFTSNHCPDPASSASQDPSLNITITNSVTFLGIIFDDNVNRYSHLENLQKTILNTVCSQRNKRNQQTATYHSLPCFIRIPPQILDYRLGRGRWNLNSKNFHTPKEGCKSYRRSPLPRPLQTNLQTTKNLTSQLSSTMWFLLNIIH